MLNINLHVIFAMNSSQYVDKCLITLYKSIYILCFIMFLIRRNKLEQKKQNRKTCSFNFLISASCQVSMLWNEWHQWYHRKTQFFVGCGPFQVTVTIRIIAFLGGDLCKPFVINLSLCVLFSYHLNYLNAEYICIRIPYIYIYKREHKHLTFGGLGSSPKAKTSWEFQSDKKTCACLNGHLPQIRVTFKLKDAETPKTSDSNCSLYTSHPRL